MYLKRNNFILSSIHLLIEKRCLISPICSYKCLQAVEHQHLSTYLHPVNISCAPIKRSEVRVDPTKYGKEYSKLHQVRDYKYSDACYQD